MIHPAQLILARIWRHWWGRKDTCHREGEREDIQGFCQKYIWVIRVSSLLEVEGFIKLSNNSQRVHLKQEDGPVDVGEVADLDQLDHLQGFDQLGQGGSGEEVDI